MVGKKEGKRETSRRSGTQGIGHTNEQELLHRVQRPEAKSFCDCICAFYTAEHLKDA